MIWPRTLVNSTTFCSSSLSRLKITNMLYVTCLTIRSSSTQCRCRVSLERTWWTSRWPWKTSHMFNSSRKSMRCWLLTYRSIRTEWRTCQISIYKIIWISWTSESWKLRAGSLHHWIMCNMTLSLLFSKTTSLIWKRELLSTKMRKQASRQTFAKVSESRMLWGL